MVKYYNLFLQISQIALE